MANERTDATSIPDRRRNRFALNGGPRPTVKHRQDARVGIAAARAALESVDPTPAIGAPSRQRRPLRPGAVARAYAGIADARAALRSAAESGPAADHAPDGAPSSRRAA